MLNKGTLFRDARNAIFPPPDKLRFVNYYLYHGCDLAGQCEFCRVPMQKVKNPDTGKEVIMTQAQRREAFEKLKKISIPGAKMSILGGEPTLRPDLLIEAINDAVSFGFRVNTISNGYALTPELIRRLAEVGLEHLGISIDAGGNGPRQNLEKALELHQSTRQAGIMPVINLLVSSLTDFDVFKEISLKIIKAKCFLSLVVTSPDVGGAFSSAGFDLVPTNRQLRQISRWLLWKKFTTGFVMSSYGYLRVLRKCGRYDSRLDQENALNFCGENLCSMNKIGEGSK